MLYYYLIVLYIGSIQDFKYKEINDLIHIAIILIAIIFKEIHISGLLIGIFLLLVSLKYDNAIGGGDIKYLLATGLLMGIFKTYLIFALAMVFALIVGIYFYIKSKINKKKFEQEIALMPYFFVSSLFLYFLGIF